MKENSIEEDIKNIEEIIELSKEEIDAKDENVTAILDIEDLISLEHILSDYKRVLKENEELKRKNKTLEELLQGNLYELYKYYKELADTYQGNCIPVQKVKDKIEELDKKVKNYQCVENRINLYQRKVLQELLEGRKI